MEKEMERISKFTDEMTDMINEEISKALQGQGGKMGHCGGSPVDILKTSGASIKKSLLMKADKIDIEKLYAMKSNKADTEIMLDCQQMICKYFKQLLVLFIEVVNF